VIHIFGLACFDHAMAYRRTDRIAHHLAARQNAIVAAARSLAAEAGMATVQIVPVSERVGIAAGTVYRYFPAKIDLVRALVAAVAEREIGAMGRAADAAPGPLSALAAEITTFAARATRNRRLTWAMLGEPVDAQVDAVQLGYRKALAAELEGRIRVAIAGGHLPELDPVLASAALVGILLAVLFGPLAPAPNDAPGNARETVQMLTLMSLRALGIADARARGLVVQSTWPPDEAA
jgi:AcrR family transcriptional regulator